MGKAQAFAPATIANLSVGFDTLGLALKSMGDTVEVSFNGTSENRIVQIINGDNLPTEIDQNCSGMVIVEMQKKLNNFRGVDIKITKGFVAGSGLGSSSASSAAAALAYNDLVQAQFSKTELVQIAAKGETVSGGDGHYDNVAPAIFGGLVLVDAQEKIRQLPIPKGMCAIVCRQNTEVKTIEARKLVPKEISIVTARKQWAAMGLFVSGLYESDFEKIADSLHDFIAEPFRKQLIPNYNKLEELALENGGLNLGLSGSGPAVFSLAENEKIAQKITKSWQQLLVDIDPNATIFYEVLNK